MNYQDFYEFLKVSALIWVNVFFFVSSFLTIFIWFAIAKTKNKVHDTLDTVQGAAFSIYENFDRKSSQVAGVFGNLIGGIFSGGRRRK